MAARGVPYRFAAPYTAQQAAERLRRDDPEIAQKMMNEMSDDVLSKGGVPRVNLWLRRVDATIPAAPAGCRTLAFPRAWLRSIRQVLQGGNVALPQGGQPGGAGNNLNAPVNHSPYTVSFVGSPQTGENIHHIGVQSLGGASSLAAAIEVSTEGVPDNKIKDERAQGAVVSGPRASSISAAQGTASNGPAASPEAFAHSGLLATSKRSSNAMGRPLPITPESTQAWASMLACRARFSSKSMTIGAPIAKTAPSAPLYSPLTSGLYEHSSSSASAGHEAPPPPPPIISITFFGHNLSEKRLFLKICCLYPKCGQVRVRAFDMDKRWSSKVYDCTKCGARHEIKRHVCYDLLHIVSGEHHTEEN